MEKRFENNQPAENIEKSKEYQEIERELTKYLKKAYDYKLTHTDLEEIAPIIEEVIDYQLKTEQQYREMSGNVEDKQNFTDYAFITNPVVEVFFRWLLRNFEISDPRGYLEKTPKEVVKELLKTGMRNKIESNPIVENVNEDSESEKLSEIIKKDLIRLSWQKYGYEFTALDWQIINPILEQVILNQEQFKKTILEWRNSGVKEEKIQKFYSQGGLNMTHEVFLRYLKERFNYDITYIDFLKKFFNKEIEQLLKG